MVSDVSFWRRLGAIFYDFLLIGASVFIVGGILSTIVAQVSGLGQITAGSTLARLLFLVEILMAFGLFGWFWTHGGQTLGMRAWKIRVVDENGQAINWQQAGMRFASSIVSWLALGVGFLISIFDENNLTWHDRLSRTYLVRV